MQTGTIYSRGILAISLLALLTIAAYLIYVFGIKGFPDLYSPEERRAEYANIFSHLPAVLPALLGLYLHNKPWVTRLDWIGYIIYLVLVLLSYSSIWWSDDALEAGLMFVLLMPYCLLMSIYLIYRMIARGRAPAA